jgi:hypothetical protein
MPEFCKFAIIHCWKTSPNGGNPEKVPLLDETKNIEKIGGNGIYF